MKNDSQYRIFTVGVAFFTCSFLISGKMSILLCHSANTWEQRELGSIANIIGGGTPATKNPEYWNGKINWYTPAEIGSDIFVIESQRKITELGLKKSSAQLLPAGRTVLFTSRASIGATAILARSAATNQGFQSMILNDSNLAYFIFTQTPCIANEAQRKASGSTFNEISGKTLGGINIPIPNYLEAVKISRYFHLVDRIVTLHQRKQNINLLEVFLYAEIMHKGSVL